MQGIIAARRDGRTHTEEELRTLARTAADGSAPDYQLSAWLMAAYLNPLTPQETAWLTLAMADSGERLHLEGLPKPWVDKHSTGGVGDKTTIVLLPLLASCGLTMVKMSGRGLGITGGTIDKLGSVPGLRLDLAPEEMIAQARKIGIALTGQTPALAPADKALYSLRDATATVDSIPLIVSSILSKKIAAGAETVVLDVKCGSGAFMPDEREARRLALALAETAKLAGLRLRIAITDMNQPLGRCVGNSLEVAEAAEVLRNEVSAQGPTARFRELCVHLAAMTLAACGAASDTLEGRMRAERALVSGEALGKAQSWFEAQGADPGVLQTGLGLGAAPFCLTVPNEGAAGYVAGVDAATVGRVVLGLGGGRANKEDEIDPTVGVEVHVTVGAFVEAGEPLFSVHARTREEAEAAARDLRRGLTVSATEAFPGPGLILGEI
jgi:pyrimidine-nucleoside phosphorylase